MKLHNKVVVAFRTQADKRFAKIIRKEIHRIQISDRDKLEELKCVAEIISVNEVSDTEVVDYYWVCKVRKGSDFEVRVLKGDEIGKIIETDCEISILTGPHESFAKAQYSLDILWEDPE